MYFELFNFRCAFGIMDHQKGAREKLVPLSMDSNKSQESTDNNASTDGDFLFCTLSFY